MSTRKITTAGLILFGISLLLSSCKAIQPVQVGPFVGYEDTKAPTEMNDHVSDQTLESP